MFSETNKNGDAIHLKVLKTLAEQTKAQKNPEEWFRLKSYQLHKIDGDMQTTNFKKSRHIHWLKNKGLSHVIDEFKKEQAGQDLEEARDL